MNKTFNNLQSTAINSIEVVDNTVKVVYNSNVDKEYTFNCNNIDQFVEDLSSELISIELTDNKGSVGRFINQQIKSAVLVESK
jgi:hypothetical protein